MKKSSVGLFIFWIETLSLVYAAFSWTKQTPLRCSNPTETANQAAKLRLSAAATGIASSVITPVISLDRQLKDHKSLGNYENDLKVGVLMLNLGGPETSDDVEGFLYNLFADPDIIRLPSILAPLQSVIAFGIAKRRAPKSKAAYESIGGGSPILKYSNAQARLLEEALKRDYGITAKTYIGMRYWHPFTEEALDQIQRDGIQALVILPLYPQFSISTSGSSLRVLQEEFSKHGSRYTDLVHTVIPSWYERRGYVNAMTNLIQRELDSFTLDEVEHARREHPDLATKHILFSAHGVPQSYIDAGDPYKMQIERCVAIIQSQLERTNSDIQVHLSYQSRVGPVEWLRPYTDDVLKQLGGMGVTNLVVVPISFVSEHIETLEEIDMEYRELAEESGVENWRRCPALNTDDRFIDDMADMVVEALIEPVQTVTEACVANNCGGDDVDDLVNDEGIIITNTVGVGAMVEAAPRRRKSSKQRSNGSSNDLQISERVNARVAMAGVVVTILLEIFSGKPLTHWLTGL